MPESCPSTDKYQQQSERINEPATMDTELPSRRSLRSNNNNLKIDDASAKAKVPSMDHKTLMVMFFGLVLDLLAFTMILPLLPALLEYYGQDEQDGLYRSMKSCVHSFREVIGVPDTPRWNSVLFGGVIGSLFSLLQFLASPVIGAASDVYGRKPLMLLSMMGVALSYVVWAISRNFTLFVLARIIGGISKGNVSLSTAIVADICPPEKRGKGMAAVGVAFSVGFIIGPLIGAYFSRRTNIQDEMFFTPPALFALFLAVVDIVFLLVFLKETLPAEKRSTSLGRGLSGVRKFIHPVALFQFEAVQGLPDKDLRAVRGVGLVYFLYLFLYSGLEFTLTFLTHNRFNYDSLQQGKMFFLIGIIMVLVQGGFVRRIKPGKEIRMSKVAICVLMPAFVLVGIAQSQTVLYLGLVLYAFASATVVPCLTTLASSYGSVEQKGTVLGIFRSLGALARTVGPVISCTLYWSLGEVWCYTLGAVGFLLPLVMFRRIQSSKDC